MMVVGVALAILCVISGAGQWKAKAWDGIPLEMKTQISTHNFSGDRVLSVMCFPGTKEAFDLFNPDNTLSESTIPSVTWSFLGDNAIAVAVSPYGNQYWFPWSVAFTQGTYQYDVGFGDYISVHGPFDGGLLRKGTQVWGFIRIPAEIDVVLPFTVWIDEDSGIIEAYYGIEDDPGEDE